jgi:hypothetical protein
MRKVYLAQGPAKTLVPQKRKPDAGFGPSGTQRKHFLAIWASHGSHLWARYAIRIKANAVLERKIAHLLRRPVGRPSHKAKVFYHSFRYRAGSWDCARRVVAKVEWPRRQEYRRCFFGENRCSRSCGC